MFQIKKIEKKKNKKIRFHKNYSNLKMTKPIIIGIGGPNFSGYYELQKGIVEKCGDKLVNSINIKSFLKNKKNEKNNEKNEIEIEIDKYETDYEDPDN